MSKKFYLSVGTFFILFWYSLFSFFERKEPVSVETREDLLSLQQQIDVLKRLVKYEADTLAEAKNRLRELKTEQKSRGDRLHVRVHEDRSWKEPIPILVFVCNRPGAVKTHVEKLLRLRPSAERFPIIVSQDCDNDEVKNAVLAFGDQIEYVKHVSGEKANIKVPPQHSQWVTYYRIARHYKLALDHVFLDRKYTTVVITEDDLDVSPDFFEYFSATRYLLDSDPLLWCVSAWNDNGKVGNIDSLASSKLYRSDFFPGLGWMMNKKTWEEIGLIWPTGFWDDWMRDPARRKGRQCIRPEISRTGMTPDGAVGASKGQFFRTHLAKILVNRSPVNFTKTNLDYLLQKNYDPAFEEEVFRKSKLINIEQVGSYTLDPQNRNTSIRVEYNGNIDYIRKADKLHIMHDFKAGVPRTAYKGVVSCYLNGVRIYLAPDRNIIKGYDSQWEVPVQFGD